MFKSFEPTKRKNFSPASTGFKSSKARKPSVSPFAANSPATKLSRPGTSSNGPSSSNPEPDGSESSDVPGLTVSNQDIINVVEDALETFKMNATLEVQIHGGNAHSVPGSLNGPGMRNLIKHNPYAIAFSQGPNNRLNKDYFDLVADIIGQRFDFWLSTFHVPPQLWYPMYSFLPMPAAPPSMNIPAMLINMGYSRNFLTSVSGIRSELRSRMNSDLRDVVQESQIDGISADLSFLFGNWLQTDVVSNILGSGQVPGFKPPFSFGGPVIGKGRGMPFR